MQSSLQTLKKVDVDSVQNRLQTLLLRLNNMQGTRMIWDRLLLAPDQRRLGPSFEEALKRHGSGLHMWIEVHRVTPARAVLDVARQLDFISESDYRYLARQQHVETGDYGTTALRENALKNCKLVMVRSAGSSELFWEGAPVTPEGGWLRKPRLWNFIWAIVDGAKKGKPIMWDELDCENEQTVKHRKARLKKFLPQAMYARIQSGPAPGSYKIDMDISQIMLIVENEDDSY